MNCHLCGEDQVKPYFRDEKRDWAYWQCRTCDLVFRDRETYLSASEEKQRYQTHNNSIENQGYVKFLTPAVEKLIPYLNKGDQGLDFGCGPGPIINILFSRRGFEVNNYDPYFYNDAKIFDKQYDFITCTEVIEHLYDPLQTLNQLFELLKSNGFLMLMTDPQPGIERFPQWGYRTDNTHVCFYSIKTFQWISEKWNYEIIFCEGKLTLFKKKS